MTLALKRVSAISTCNFKKNMDEFGKKSKIIKYDVFLILCWNQAV